MIAAPDDAFELTVEDSGALAVAWGAPFGEARERHFLAQLAPGRSLLEPAIRTARTLDRLSAQSRAALRTRLERWLDAQVARHLAPLRRARRSGARWPGDLRIEPLFEPGGERGAALRRQPVEVWRGADRRLERRAARKPGEDVPLPELRRRARPSNGQRARSSDRSARTRHRAPRIKAVARRSELLARAALGGRPAAAACRRAWQTDRRGARNREVALGSGPTLSLTIGGDGNWKRVGAARADVAHQDGGAAVDERWVNRSWRASDSPRISTARVRSARVRAAPSAGGVRPRYRPSCDAGEAMGQRLDVAAHIVEPGSLGGELRGARAPPSPI